MRTFVVTRSDEGDWVLHRLGDQGILHEGPFMETWLRGAALAAGNTPACLVALNSEGRAIALEIVDVLGESEGFYAGPGPC